MFRRLLSLSILLAIAVDPATAEEDEPLWGNVQHWAIRIDRTLNFGCFLVTQFDGGTVFRLGVNRTEQNRGYVILGNSKWKSLEVGKRYQISLKFDNLAPWSTNAHVINVGTSSFLFIPFSDTKFIQEFAVSHRVVVSYDFSIVTTLPLNGTAAATAELAKCQKAMDELAPRSPNNGPGRDPFARPGGDRDPFRNPPPVRSNDPFRRG